MHGYARGLESDLLVTSLGDKDQYGLSFRLRFIETCAPLCAECNFLGFRRSQLVQGDRLVSYPPVFIYVSLFLPSGISMQALTCCFVYFCDLDRDGAIDDKVE